MGKRLFILSIDGVPHSLIQTALTMGKMPHFQRILQKGQWLRMNSALPVVSSVAWATFSTGVNPARHGIFGFVDRAPDLQYVILTSRHFREKSLWKRLSESGKRVIVINVPGTYPPEPIDGIIVGDFLSPSLEKAAYPSDLVLVLKDLGYIIDPDPQLALTDRSALISQIFAALAARENLTFYLLEKEDWDFFMLHVMETDRINHFFWDAKESAYSPYHDDFWRFYAAIDELIGRLDDWFIDSETEFMILSDHGFCEIGQEVDINRYLIELGFASFKQGARSLQDLDSTSGAYSLTPGRIYINLRGRELRGNVRSEESARLCSQLADALLELKDPISGTPVIDRIYRREEVYRGPMMGQAPELIAHPHNGFDLKAGFGAREGIFQKSVRSGMHTYEDALLYVRGKQLRTTDNASILDATPTIFELMGLVPPPILEGMSLIKAAA